MSERSEEFAAPYLALQTDSRPLLSASAAGSAGQNNRASLPTRYTVRSAHSFTLAEDYFGHIVIKWIFLAATAKMSERLFLSQSDSPCSECLWSTSAALQCCSAVSLSLPFCAKLSRSKHGISDTQLWADEVYHEISRLW